MASKTEIGNLALQHLGVSRQMASMDTEQSTEARVLNLAFDAVRDAVLRECPWPFATAYAVLGLVAGTTASPVNKDWTFAYRYPADCLMVRRLTNPGRPPAGRLAFRIGRDASGRLIYTDTEDAEIEYTARITDPQEFDPLFVTMMAWRLAAAGAAPLARMPNAVQWCMRMYELEKQRAQAAAFNESQDHPPPEAEWIEAR